MKIRFELSGIMPLLMHADDVEASDMLTAWRKAPENKGRSVAGDDRSPAWTWQTYVYHDGQQVRWPAVNISVALRKAGTQLILKKQKTFKELTQSGMFIDAEYCELLASGKSVSMESLEEIRELPFSDQASAVRDLGFRLFVKRAAVGSSKHVRVRPRFDDWTVRGTATIVSPDLSLDIVNQLFELAGNVGLGDWRPGGKTPGPFGMFTATIEQVK